MDRLTDAAGAEYDDDSGDEDKELAAGSRGSGGQVMAAPYRPQRGKVGIDDACCVFVLLLFSFFRNEPQSVGLPCGRVEPSLKKLHYLSALS